MISSIDDCDKANKKQRKYTNKKLWTTIEDFQLSDLVQFYGINDWPTVAQYVMGRTSKQCRERWKTKFNPNIIKGNWRNEEDELILQLYTSIGSKWSIIAKSLAGRSENDVRNRFFTLDRYRTRNDLSFEAITKNDDNETTVPINNDNYKVRSDAGEVYISCSHFGGTANVNKNDSSPHKLSESTTNSYTNYSPTTAGRHHRSNYDMTVSSNLNENELTHAFLLKKQRTIQNEQDPHIIGATSISLTSFIPGSANTETDTASLAKMSKTFPTTTKYNYTTNRNSSGYSSNTTIATSNIASSNATINESRDCSNSNSCSNSIMSKTCQTETGTNISESDETSRSTNISQQSSNTNSDYNRNIKPLNKSYTVPVSQTIKTSSKNFMDITPSASSSRKQITHNHTSNSLWDELSQLRSDKGNFHHSSDTNYNLLQCLKYQHDPLTMIAYGNQSSTINSLISSLNLDKNSDDDDNDEVMGIVDLKDSFDFHIIPRFMLNTCITKQSW